MNRSPLLYLDHNATTPVDPRVLEAMLPWLRDGYGNPSSPHAAGMRARSAVECAREQAAALLDASPEGIVFGSGGTEADNHAVFGAARLGAVAGRHELVISAVEHPAICEPCRELERTGFVTRVAGVDRECRVEAAGVAAMLGPATALVSVMLANNETGALQPVAAIAAAARGVGALSHTDAAQAVGKIPVSMRALGVDLLSVAGHKLYAPKGVGLLCLRQDLALPNLMFGAGHESGRRPGTENVAAIVGLGVACEIAGRDLAAEGARQAALRDELQELLCAAIPAAQVHAATAERLPNTLSIGFPGTTGAAILAYLPEVAVSAGAACHGSGGGSTVLAAMGVAPRTARGTLRLSLGRGTTAADVPRAAAAVALAVSRAQAGA
ncbi:MAG: cysteine desulfurase [bacterium]|nr:cysteine desulfurase [bacterium]